MAPALTEPVGVARLRALVDRWLAYVETPLFPGGCFWAANLPDFDSRPGPVRDALARHQQAWRDLLATQLRHAIDAGEISAQDPDLVAFQVDAVLIAANTAFRFDDHTAVAKVHTIVESFLTPTR